MNYCSIHGKISSAAQMALIWMENLSTHLQDVMFSLILDGKETWPKPHNEKDRQADK